MASVSASNVSSRSNASTSPQLKGLKKVLSSRRHSSEVPSEGGTRSSIDSVQLERSPTLQSSGSSINRDTGKPGTTGVRTLIPGHSKRQRKKQREEEVRAALESEVRGRPVLPSPTTANIAASKSNSSLLTDAEINTPPPLVSRDSHQGFFTTSSPQIITESASNGQNVSDQHDSYTGATQAFPSIIEPESSPKSTPKLKATPVLPAPGLVDRADSLQVETNVGRRDSISSRLRGKSPARKVRDIFSKASRSPRSSPERESNLSMYSGDAPSEYGRVRDSTDFDSKPAQIPPVSQGRSVASKKPPAIETSMLPPSTPPSTQTPLTTVTPPTPTEKRLPLIPPSEPNDKYSDSDSSSITVSLSGNMISHRRVRSASSAMHSKSKLSMSMAAPLTPTTEEFRSTPDKSTGSRSATPTSGGFFSSWVSAAQNAASTLTNLTTQNRGRSDTAGSEPTKGKAMDDRAKTATESTESMTKKKLAIETLGSGDLNFAHLGIANGLDEKDAGSVRPSLTDPMQLSDFNRNEAQAKEEDTLAQRAVSAAYERPPVTTPVAELPDPIGSLKSSQTVDSLTTAVNTTTPNGSIFEGESGPVKRSNSVRSKLANRRSRGSSIATGHSTIGAMIGASTSALVNPALATKATGFTPAPKARNRSYHQQFRSVPEDDNLIEDYSCALQREILLAGRIYISEGHICFSSNILGWVTTLIISFEEIVSIERENTAMIIPNAIAIQTLHARHTIRSLLSREATFDLIIGIWKVNHPASFQKSVNGKQLIAERTQDVVANAMGTNVDGSQGSDEDSDGESGSEEGDGEEEGSAPSVVGSSASFAGSDFVDARSIGRKSSALNGGPAATGASNGLPGDATATTGGTSGTGVAVDYPGPTTHAATECTDSSTHYDKIIKDEIIPAPLGKIYSLLYGPQSGVFVRKYLVDECKCTDLVLEDDKKGITIDNKSRQYSYTKPLYGAIGPKSTKCITTENLDFFDLEKAVSVTCTTQTPSVPSGNAFSTKTRYCLTWAPGNATRLQMNCMIEWTAKSWLKGPIENGANEGQQQYGDGLVKSLKAAVGRSRGATVGSKGAKSGKKRRRSEKKSKSEKDGGQPSSSTNWGLFEPARPFFQPATDIVKPIVRMDLFVGMLAIMVFTMWFGGSSRSGTAGHMGLSLNHAERSIAYEELWQKQDSELWDWLESRTGAHQIMTGRSKSEQDETRQQWQERRQRSKLLKSQNMAAKLRAEKRSRTEIREAVRVTQERLDAMQHALGAEPSPDASPKQDR